MGAALRVSPEPRRKEMSLDARHPIHTDTLITQTRNAFGHTATPNNKHGPLGSVRHPLSVSVGFTRGCAGSVTTVHALGGCSPLLVFARQGKFCFFGWFYTAGGFASQGKVRQGKASKDLPGGEAAVSTTRGRGRWFDDGGTQTHSQTSIAGGASVGWRRASRPRTVSRSLPSGIRIE